MQEYNNQQYNNQDQFNKFLNLYKSYWTQTFDYKGRTTRKDFWFLVLFNYVIVMCFNFLLQLSAIGGEILLGIFAILFICFTFANTFPGISLCVRRLHDIGKSCASYIIYFVLQFLFSIYIIIAAIWIVFEFIDNLLTDFDNLFEASLPVASLIILFLIFTLVMFIYSIVMIVFFCLPSDKDNKYGPCVIDEKQTNNYMNNQMNPYMGNDNYSYINNKPNPYADYNDYNNKNNINLDLEKNEKINLD